MQTPNRIRVECDLAGELNGSDQVAWALDTLLSRARASGIEIVEGGDAGMRLLLISDRRHAGLAGTELPEADEAFAVVPKGNDLTVWAQGPRGVVYALTELADRLRFRGAAGLALAEPIVETPALRVRAIARTFACEATDKEWFYDKTGWREYLSMLATNRYNRFALAFGMAYNYPYHHYMIRDVYLKCPYPFLVSVPGHDVHVAGLADDEREKNLEMLRFIGREAAKRGLDFQLGLWTQRYDFDTADKASHRIEGVDAATFPQYCRDALSIILTEVPEITGLTFRVHVEGGIEEGDYDFWSVLFEAATGTGREIEIDLHAKGLDHKMVEVAKSTGMPVVVSPKYIAEHMALPYHPASIRESEYPPKDISGIRETLSQGTRKFMRYSYGDMLSTDRDWKIVFRIWPGTQRVLLWGDPEMASGYGRSAGFCGAEGVELCEPQYFRGRMGTGMPGGRHNYVRRELIQRYDWEKYEYQYRVWGRRLYAPDTDHDDIDRFLTETCGDAASDCEAGLALGSRVLPLVTLSHGVSVSNNIYWPEMYTNITVIGDGTLNHYGRDTPRPVRFGTVSTFDPQLISNPKDYVAALLDEDNRRRYSPLDIADWLEAMADGIGARVQSMRGSASFDRPEVQRISIDLRILAGIARFFAEKFRAACWAELFLLSDDHATRERAGRHLERAVMAWKEAGDAATGTYQDDISFGRQHFMRETWAFRLADIRKEARDLDGWRKGDGGGNPTHPGESGKALIAALEARRPTSCREMPVQFPTSFTPGEAVEITADGGSARDLVLHYRHVNQAERWCSVPMDQAGGSWKVAIPGDYTSAPFYLQFYITALDGETGVLSPGLAANLSNEPYYTIAPA